MVTNYMCMLCRNVHSWFADEKCTILQPTVFISKILSQYNQTIHQHDQIKILCCYINSGGQLLSYFFWKIQHVNYKTHIYLFQNRTLMVDINVTLWITSTYYPLMQPNEIPLMSKCVIFQCSVFYGTKYLLIEMYSIAYEVYRKKEFHALSIDVTIC